MGLVAVREGRQTVNLHIQVFGVPPDLRLSPRRHVPSLSTELALSRLHTFKEEGGLGFPPFGVPLNSAPPPAAKRYSCVMNLAVTIAILVIAAVALVASNIISRRPVELGEIRILPYSGIQFLSIVAILVTLAHLISLLTGQPFVGRSGL